MTDHYITPEQVCIGIFVQLDLGWMHHPFTFSSFIVKTQEQVEIIRRLGLQRIKYDPKKSSSKPLQPTAAPPLVVAAPEHDELVNRELALKAQRIDQLRTIRDNIARVEQQFIKVADSIRNINRSLRTHPEQAAKDSDAVVKQMVETMMSGDDITLHAISEKLGEETYFHSLNVSVLSLMLGRALAMDAVAIHCAGLGALLHDIGKLDVPSTITLKTEPLNRAEQTLMELHCDYGVRLASKMNLSEGVLGVIMQHHECVDGSGYPKRLRGEQITMAAKVVAIANTYDNLCNPVNINEAMTPSEALSHLFAIKRAKFDDRLLKLFIKRLGIYPPGSIVQLSNDMIGIVVSVNPEFPLRPNVLVYDANVPKDEALIVALESETDLKVIKNLRPAQLPRQIFQYLNPRKHMTYFFDPKKKEVMS
jgi:putative nucleotidyltransferase with HDIG domain